VTFPPRYRERNLELIRLADDLQSIGGVVADRRGRVLALYASFSRGNARTNDSFLAGLAADRVLEALTSQLPGESQWRTLEVGLDPLTLAQARERGLTNEQAEHIEEHAAARARVLSVRRVSAISPASAVLKEGDLLLAIDGETVTRFHEVEAAARAPEVVLDVIRDGELRRFEVETDVVSGRGTDEALLFAGAILQAPHAAVVRQYPAPQPGVYLSWVFFGSPASQYELPTTRRIVAVDGVPTPDLASFIESVRGREDRSAVRVAMLSLDGRSEVATLKLDLEHWPTTLLRRGDDGWQRIPIDVSGPPE
jgi:S1-C subfamily serine protease